MNNVTLYALHGFLGRPGDWAFLGSSCVAPNLFHSIHSYSVWAERFNAQVAPAAHNILIGYSMGGRLALHALLANPSLWAAAILISTHYGLPSDEERERRLRGDREWAHRFRTEEWGALMGQWNGQGVLLSTVPAVRDEAAFSREALAEALEVWSLGRQKHLRPQLEALDIPILWVTGERDEKFSSLELNLAHPLSRKWIAKDAGHRVLFEKENSLLEQSQHFIQEVLCQQPFRCGNR